MTAVAHHSNPEDARDSIPEIVLFLLRHYETLQPSIDRLQDLLFLVDREHTRSFAVVLTFLPWVRQKSGPRSDALLPVLEKLEHEGQLPVGYLARGKPQRSIAEPPMRYAPDQRENLSARAARSLQRVLWQYGTSSNGRIHEAIESTRSYQQAAIGELIDLSRERAWLEEEVSRQGTDRRAWGDPAESAAEDEEIMEFMDRWRSLGRSHLRER